MNTHEYAEAASEQTLDAAVRRSLLGLSATDAEALKDRAAAAVADLFCPCITDLADVVEDKLSDIRAALIAEVVRRAGLVLAARAKAGADCTEA